MGSCLSYSRAMCRSIRVLHNFQPPATPEEIRAAAIQYVRKISGTTRPSKANQAAFEAAADAVTAASELLLDSLVSTGSFKNREQERLKAKARFQKRV